MSSPDLDESTQEALLSICQNKKQKRIFLSIITRNKFHQKKIYINMF
jgi:hypothetical protein